MPACIPHAPAVLRYAMANAIPNAIVRSPCVRTCVRTCVRMSRASIGIYSHLIARAGNRERLLASAADIQGNSGGIPLELQRKVDVQPNPGAVTLPKCCCNVAATLPPGRHADAARGIRAARPSARNGWGNRSQTVRFPVGNRSVLWIGRLQAQRRFFKVHQPIGARMAYGLRRVPLAASNSRGKTTAS